MELLSCRRSVLMRKFQWESDSGIQVMVTGTATTRTDMVMGITHIDIIGLIGTTAITIGDPITAITATIGTIVTIIIIIKLEH